MSRGLWQNWHFYGKEYSFSVNFYCLKFCENDFAKHFITFFWHAKFDFKILIWTGSPLATTQKRAILQLVSILDLSNLRFMFEAIVVKLTCVFEARCSKKNLIIFWHFDISDFPPNMTTKSREMRADFRQKIMLP